MSCLDASQSRRRRARVLTRDLVSLVHRQIPEPPDHPDFILLEDADYRQMTDYLAGQIDRTHGLWIFAYGSLLWNPTFRHVEHRIGRVHGWHRSFCLHLTRWRGTPEEPGLMLALDRGGACNGVLFRLEEADEQKEIDLLLRREIRYHKGGNPASLVQGALEWFDHQGAGLRRQSSSAVLPPGAVAGRDRDDAGASLRAHRLVRRVPAADRRFSSRARPLRPASLAVAGAGRRAHPVRCANQGADCLKPRR